MQSLRPLVDEGLVRRAAVSNYSLAQWQEAERALRHPVYADQVPFSLVKPRPAADLVPYAAAMGRLVVASSPLGQGVLARVGAGSDGTPNPVRRFNPLWRGAAAERLLPLQVDIRDIARAIGATPAQVALAWVVSHPNTVAIPGARTAEQLIENAAAADLVLDAAALARLGQAARSSPDRASALRPRCCRARRRTRPASSVRLALRREPGAALEVRLARRAGREVDEHRGRRALSLRKPWMPPIGTWTKSPGLALAPRRPVVDPDPADEHVEPLGRSSGGSAGPGPPVPGHRPAIEAEQAARRRAGREVVDGRAATDTRGRAGRRAAEASRSARRRRRGTGSADTTSCASSELQREHVLVPLHLARCR